MHPCWHSSQTLCNTDVLSLTLSFEITLQVRVQPCALWSSSFLGSPARVVLMLVPRVVTSGTAAAQGDGWLDGSLMRR